MTNLPSRLNGDYVVAVNEYAGVPGHVNMTFYARGANQGTFGENSQGTDINGVFHAQGAYSYSMPGGVFVESNAGAQTHWVIVTQDIYNQMRGFALSEAQATSAGDMHYSIVQNNCVDFLSHDFQQTTLGAQFKDVYQYFVDKTEPVAIYAGAADALHNAGVNWYYDPATDTYGLALSPELTDTVSDTPVSASIILPKDLGAYRNAPTGDQAAFDNALAMMDPFEAAYYQGLSETMNSHDIGFLQESANFFVGASLSSYGGPSAGPPEDLTPQEPVYYTPQMVGVPPHQVPT